MAKMMRGYKFRRDRLRCKVRHCTVKACPHHNPHLPIKGCYSGYCDHEGWVACVPVKAREGVDDKECKT